MNLNTSCAADRQNGRVRFLVHLVVWAAAWCSSAEASDQLILFTQPGASPLADRFQAEDQPRFESLARELGVEFRVIDVSRGAPEEVRLTPLVVFQNARGRSLYQGRYTTLDRVRSFVRTSRSVPKGAEPLVKVDVPVMEIGRVRIASPIKITPLEGRLPDPFDAEEFASKALRSVQEGFSRMNVVSRVELSRSDRLFYMDFHPWRSENGRLYVTGQLFSQFHCKEPIAEVKTESSILPFSDPFAAFDEATGLLEDAILRQAADPAGGDGFDPVPKSTPQVSWEELGLPLPEANPDSAPVVRSVQLPLRWVVADPIPGDPPQIQFRFPAPLDMYSGEARDAEGRIILAQEAGLAGATGTLTAPVRGVTMGEPDLDAALLGPAMLDAEAYPEARFELDSLSTDSSLVRFGELAQMVLAGRFTLCGVTVPLEVKSTIEPVLTDDGSPRLIVSGAFAIDLRPFKIEAPDGPEDKRYSLLFDLNLTFEPESDQVGLAPPRP